MQKGRRTEGLQNCLAGVLSCLRGVEERCYAARESRPLRRYPFDWGLRQESNDGRVLFFRISIGELAYANFAVSRHISIKNKGVFICSRRYRKRHQLQYHPPQTKVYCWRTNWSSKKLIHVKAGSTAKLRDWLEVGLRGEFLVCLQLVPSQGHNDQLKSMLPLLGVQPKSTACAIANFYFITLGFQESSYAN